ncbi:hypothetical protein [Streptomyces sp. bgisy100]|uniref:hypothetical protein n=1 Tax=Streptomyces sp. bgisy100 TaxID=3413783 RepID=UPI003D74650B
MIRILTTEMWRGEAKWVAALMTAVGAWYFASEDPAQSDWIGWWTQTSMNVQLFGVIVMGSVMSGVAAWGAGRDHRHRTLDWADTAARSGWTRNLVLWLASWLWSLLAYAVFTAIAFSRTAAISDVSSPAWTPLLLGASMLGLQVAVGVAFGALLPSRVLAPFVGIAWYGLFVGLAFAPKHWLNHLFPAIDEHWDTTFTPSTGRLLTAAVWCLAAGLCALAVPALKRRSALGRQAPALIALTVVAATAGTALVVLPPPARDSFWAKPAPQPARPVCATSGRTTACLWPDDRHLLPRVNAAVKRLDSGLGKLSGFNRAFYATGLDLPGGRTAELPLNSPSESESDLADSLFSAALPQPAGDCEPHMLKSIGGYPDTFLFEAAVRARAGAPSEYYGDRFGKALERITKAPSAERDAWIEGAAARIRSCRPVPSVPR